MSPALASLLFDIRQHAAYRELLTALEKPKLRPFRVAEAEKVETARARWIHESGRLEQHERWLHLLSGTVPQDGEVKLEEIHD